MSRAPRDKVQWLKDGKPLGRTPDRVRVEEASDGRVHRIVFSALEDGDLGVYTIRVNGLSSEARVDMKVAPVLRLTEKFRDKVILKAGASAVLEIPFAASPKPKVEWVWRPRVRPDSEPGASQTPRFKPDVVSGLTSLPLGKVKREDAGDYVVTISNELGEVSVSVQLIVLDKPSAPRQPEVRENTGERVVFYWLEPEFLGLSVDVSAAEGLTYVVEMREATQRVGKPVTTTSELQTPIEGLQLNKSYIFSVAAKNEVGQSEFVDTKPVSTKLEYGPPRSPTNVKAVVNPARAAVSEQSIELTWEQPTDEASGAGPVSNFYIEMKPSDSTRWQEVAAEFTVPEPHCTVSCKGMKEFTKYEFRVTSENKAGKSKPSEPSNPVELGIPLEFVRPLTDVAVTEVTGEPVVLECELSRAPRDKVQWLKDGKPLGRTPDRVRVEEASDGRVHRIVFSALEDGDLGVYTIRVNGLSSEARVDMKVAPVLRLTEKFRDKVILKAGASAVLEIPFAASPKPKVEWVWRPRVRPDSEPGASQTPRFKPDVVSGLTSLPLGKVKREDAGDYVVTISNELGEVSVSVQLIVLDKPSAPRQPEVRENTGERVVFYWLEPEFLGLSVDVSAAEGLTYVVEMREATQRVGKPVTTTSELQTPIEGLQLNKSYIFSVAAKNEVGQSEFVDTKPVSSKPAFGFFPQVFVFFTF
ncbi:unnamed protein product [Dicrocoelium dendriticum]|nr:unnamed protein product [Dicrocoelium dendriticum]